MQELIQKKLKMAAIFRICIAVLAVVSVVSIPLTGVVDMDVIMPVVLVSVNALWICALVYFQKTRPFVMGAKRLAECGGENIADDISLDLPTLPRTQIYCGKRAFYCQKTGVLLPYSEIAWVYKYEKRTNGFVTERAVILRTKDGKSFRLPQLDDEINWLLSNYIIPNSPDLIIGYGAEQKRRYVQLNPDPVMAANKLKRIWGAVLVALGAVLTVVAVVNGTLVSDGGIIILGFIIGGITLIVLGNRK